MTFSRPCRAGARGFVATLLFGVASAAASASAQSPGLPSLIGPRDRARTETPAAPAKAPEAKSRVDQLIEDFRADRERALPRPPEGIADAEAARERDILLTLTHLNDRKGAP